MQAEIDQNKRPTRGDGKQGKKVNKRGPYFM